MSGGSAVPCMGTYKKSTFQRRKPPHEHLKIDSMSGKRSRGRPCRSIRDAFTESTREIELEAGNRGRIRHWSGHAMDVTQWDMIVKNGEHKKEESSMVEKK